jgi:flagellar hook-length control protein FliK
MAKASAGALRVLDLQLKPAELGLVTIRMRLSGDSIEMEIQAESEETADLLKTDTEKLSNLLRMSGYRPDMITIQSTEAASHDRSSFQRPQQGTQMEGHSFQQGGTSGQGASSRHHEERHGRDGAEVRKDSKGDQGSGGNSAGGVYL